MGIKLEKAWDEYENTSFASENDGFIEATDVDGRNVLIKSIPKKTIVYTAHDTEEPLTMDDLYEGKLIIDRRGNLFTLHYAEMNMYPCGNCGKWFFPSDGDGVFTEEGNSYCMDCVRNEEVAFPCDGCGEWHDADHYHEWDSYRCCGGGMFGWDTEGTDLHICERCSDQYAFCDECHCIVDRDCACYTDDNLYCEDCYNSEYDKELHTYHFNGDETDYSMPYLGESTREVDPLLGVEAEMDQGGKKENIIHEIREALGEEYCVACEDGSLDFGFELISCPANLVNHQNELDWSSAFDTAREYGYRGHDGGTCGLHVHVDRKFFKNSALTMDEIEGAMFVVLKNNADWIKRFSRRFEYGYCEINGDDDGEKINTITKYHEKWNGKEIYDKRNRYKAINFSRSDTIEFRIFRGTLNIETFYATLEMVDMFVRLVKRCESLEEAMEIGLNDFIKYSIMNKGYNEFYEYGMRIGIIDNNETGF